MNHNMTDPFYYINYYDHLQRYAKFSLSLYWHLFS